MQIFVRCGDPVGSVAIDCDPDGDTVLDLKRRAALKDFRIGPASNLVREGWSVSAEGQGGEAACARSSQAPDRRLTHLHGLAIYLGICLHGSCMGKWLFHLLLVSDGRLCEGPMRLR